jgi:hypothetical protein
MDHQTYHTNEGGNTDVCKPVKQHRPEGIDRTGQSVKVEPNACLQNCCGKECDDDSFQKG